MDKPLDLLVIGAGPGGYSCAARAVALGLKVALVESGPVGGLCLNRGCIPSKGHLTALEPLAVTTRVAKNQAAIETLRAGLDHLLQGTTRLDGHARLDGPGRVLVAGQVWHARHVVLATGSQATALPCLPVDGERVIGSDQALIPKRLPAHLVVVGGGAVGVEFADMYHRYGVRVTVLESADRLLPGEDEWLAAQLARRFKQNALSMRFNTAIESATVTADGVTLCLKNGDQITGDQVLVAVGRHANLNHLGLASVGLDAAAPWIVVDGYGATSVPGLWAVGDVTGPPQLAHRASHQGRIVAERVAGREVPPLDGALIPSCIYTHPQLASVGVGWGAEPGLIKGDAYFRANGLGVVSGATEGAVRLLADAATGRLRGAQLAGAGVSEMVGFLAAMIGAKLTVEQLMQATFPHPTLSESVWQAAAQLAAHHTA